MAMKRIEFMLVVSAVVLALTLGAAAQSESLGDQARAVRKEKRLPAKKVYTNDNLPTSASISVVGEPAAIAEENAASKPEGDKDKDKDKDKSKAQKEDKTAESKAPQDEQGWRDKFSAQKKKISDLEHELDVLQREYGVTAAAYYADAGYQLRDPQKWAEDDAKYRTQIADKQKQIEELKNQLQDMEEQARKAGMPSSVSDSE
jgi:predicted RNase H-like nuclease (RuvC/YqgF family)